MIVLAFTDVHGRWEVLRSIVDRDADVYVCLGDLTYGEAGIEEAAKILEPISDRLLCVPGNNERPEIMEEYFPHVLHGRKTRIGRILFGGIGGSPRTPFNTVHEWEEDEARRLLRGMGYVDVLLAHAPPAGTPLALTRSGVDAGSQAIREYIEEFGPKLVLCGHIHEHAGKETRIGGTRILNPGPGGRYVEI